MARSITRFWPRGIKNATAWAGTANVSDPLARHAALDAEGRPGDSCYAELAIRVNGTCDSLSPCPYWKRAMDIVGAICALIILAPLIAAAAIFIRCRSRGPIFFCQTRYGLNGKPFTLWKFRTIETSESSEQHRSHVTGLMEGDAPLTKLDRELPVIAGGRFLRKYGLDELPQLFNVLRGEMSLVGPRPDVLPLTSYQPWQQDRFKVLPGLTGLWQVSGKNHTTFSEMIHLDITYIHHRSMRFDLLIIVETIPSLIWGQ
jgi:lipopolysaccharide/colanic/teichoic acid biosynthesis glycosyltransferase